MTVIQYGDDDLRVGTVPEAPVKFIQICASENDLFALDDEGNIYQYNFKMKTWLQLVTSRAKEKRS